MIDYLVTHFFSHIDKELIHQILLVIFSGAVIGYERQKRDKPVGIRTSILICLGTMIFVKTGLMAVQSMPDGSGDPSRVIGQVVTGIGFLGAGTIINREGLVVGLTTAATIWVQASIGTLIGLGYLDEAFIFTILTLIILYGVVLIELQLKKLNILLRKNSKKES